MSKNRLTDLNDHLFLELERLNDESLIKASDDEFRKEMERTDRLTKVSQQIILNANTVLRARIACENSLGGETSLPPMLTS